MKDTELLSAYLDNELLPVERVSLETRLAEEPALRQELARLQQGDHLVKAYFAELDQRPLPADLETMIKNSQPAASLQVQTQVLPFPARKPPYLMRFAWASAASVLLAVGLLWFLPKGSELNPALIAALDTQPSGSVVELSASERVEILASVRRADGTVCRLYVEHRVDASSEKTACFAQRWKIQTEGKIPSEQATSDDPFASGYSFAPSYQPAAGHELPQNRMIESEERAWLLRH
ncbi:hypothetical protein HDN1F_22220 [gamma proteobacterium HdN1]|nr:hypothetical protein HDN1F_22220 [gamma proteobacterium HdN1]